MDSKTKAYFNFIANPKGRDLRKLYDSLSAKEQRDIYEGYAYDPNGGLWEGYEMPYGMSLNEYQTRVVDDPYNYEVFLATL